MNIIKLKIRVRIMKSYLIYLQNKYKIDIHK